MASDLRLELFVDDIDRAVAFYCGALGFAPMPGADSTYRPLARDGIRLSLQAIDELTADHPLMRGGRETPRGLGVEIVLEVDDLEALHGRLTELGTGVSPLQRQPWGLRDFRVSDPDGFYLRFTEPPQV